MRIVICTPVFDPSVGGLETMNMLLAKSLSDKGCDVVIVTDTNYSGSDDYPFTVVRAPKAMQLFRLYRWGEIFIHSAPVIRYSWPVFLFMRPFAIVHHSSTFNWNGRANFQSFFKRFLCKFAHNITVSRTVGESLRLPSGYQVINNAYDASCFHIMNHGKRSGFVYVGRLSPEKGVALLLEAYCQYVNNGGSFALTIVGDGSQRPDLEVMADALGVRQKVSFAGSLSREEVSEVLNDNHTLVLPSICKEAFGIVVLEAMACGCRVVGSDGDGIEEAMNGNGLLFKKGRVESLAEALEHSSTQMDPVDEYYSNISEYLSQHRIEFVSNQYLSLFNKWTSR